MSLGYIPKQYAPGGGSSGSSVRNQNNKVVGIIHAGTFTARASVAAALRSNGFNYQGLFGEYNLPQYDVIYGTGKDQKTHIVMKWKQHIYLKTVLIKKRFLQTSNLIIQQLKITKNISKLSINRIKQQPLYF
ncbi:DUF31 family putative serine protease [Mycoplasmopsis cynos]|uniref:DUF31 family putative serine protease n=1 Tax=Mycoplasmopsis cynos TaxID=171284 RepID=UPI00220C35E2|nr:hypothetical protein [Mycoplasmopsis cynos]UWV77494.1 hypothetical protein NW070_00785 [Mycoplasmopsis cynos]